MIERKDCNKLFSQKAYSETKELQSSEKESVSGDCSSFVERVLRETLGVGCVSCYNVGYDS